MWLQEGCPLHQANELMLNEFTLAIFLECYLHLLTKSHLLTELEATRETALLEKPRSELMASPQREKSQHFSSIC